MKILQNFHCVRIFFQIFAISTVLISTQSLSQPIKNFQCLVMVLDQGIPFGSITINVLANSEQEAVVKATEIVNSRQSFYGTQYGQPFCSEI